MVILFQEEALKTAEACDREAKSGKLRGPQHGVPITIKEQFWIKGKIGTPLTCEGQEMPYGT